MSLDVKDIARIKALMGQVVRDYMSVVRPEGDDEGQDEIWRTSQGDPKQIQGPPDEPMLDPDATATITPLPPPGEIHEKLEAEELAPIPEDGFTDPRGGGAPSLSHVWMGRVVTVHEALVDPQTGYYVSAQIVRIHGSYDTNNEPILTDVPNPPGDSTPTLVTAWPFPMRHDQVRWIAAVGEEVMVFIGNDGRHYFMTDDLPFPAVVIKSTVSTWEDQAGGAGLVSVAVRRSYIAGDPDIRAVVLGDLANADGTAIEYPYVRVMSPRTKQHGLRVGDQVIVEKRGLHYFTTAGRETFPAYLVTLGPNGEADPGDERYWVRELDGRVAYGDNSYTYAYSDLARTDPTGSGGIQGRWCMAINVADTTAAHDLPLVVEGNPTTGRIVEVTMHADRISEEVWYTFSGSPYLPAGAIGDLLYYNGAWVMLAIGTAGDVLITGAGGLPEWETPSECV